MKWIFKIHVSGKKGSKIQLMKVHGIHINIKLDSINYHISKEANNRSAGESW